MLYIKMIKKFLLKIYLNYFCQIIQRKAKLFFVVNFAMNFPDQLLVGGKNELSTVATKCEKLVFPQDSW